jgi:hypothetical protein
MAFDPLPSDLVLRSLREERFPEVVVGDSLTLRVLPSSALPTIEPALGEGVDEVARVGADRDYARLLECP